MHCTFQKVTYNLESLSKHEITVYEYFLMSVDARILMRIDKHAHNSFLCGPQNL